MAAVSPPREVSHRPLPPEVVRFRAAIIDAVGDSLGRFYYIDQDACLGVCPVCDAALAVRFHGRAARADLACHGGCAEQEIADALRVRQVRP